MIQYVYIPKRGKSGNAQQRFSSENYRGRFKLQGMKIEDVSLHTTDKRVAVQRLEEIARERQREQAGIIAPKALRDSAVKSLMVHLADCVADLKAKGRKKSYYGLIDVRVKTLAKACGWTMPKDVTADTFASWRTKHVAKLAAKTINDYLDAVCVLLNWMQVQGRIVANPLKVVGKVQTVGKEKVKRRALSDDEVRLLLAVSPSRKVVYLLAVLTGLRRGELRSLQWGDVHLEAPKPFMHVRASTTKNGKSATMSLRDDVVDELRSIRPGNVSPVTRVFRVPKPETVRADLKAAGIPLVDAQGRKVDLHALRHTLATNLARCGVAPRVAMEHMRHSDMRLTNKTYTDAGQLQMDDVGHKLPRYDGANAVSEMRSQKRSQMAVAGVFYKSQPVAVVTTGEVKKTLRFSGESRVLSHADTTSQTSLKSEGDGARTRNLRIDSPVL